MKLYTATGTKALIKKCNELNVGLMMVNRFQNVNKWPYFAIDNGCYSAFAQGIKWNPGPFITLLSKCKNENLKPDFIVIPDIVEGGKDSLRLSERWGFFLKEEYDYPLFLAVQDGITIEDVLKSPLFKIINGIFIGGSIKWKMNNLRYWSNFSKKYNLKTHAGRIGPYNSILKCHFVDIDSIDSTSWVQNKGWMDSKVGRYREYEKGKTKQQFIKILEEVN